MFSENSKEKDKSVKLYLEKNLNYIFTINWKLDIFVSLNKKQQKINVLKIENDNLKIDHRFYFYINASSSKSVPLFKFSKRALKCQNIPTNSPQLSGNQKIDQL